MTWPDAVQFDPQQGTASPAIESLLEGPGSAGPVVLLAVGPSAQRDGWAAHTAVAVAEAFAQRGESVLLADLSLDRPELHELLGVENEEGLSDVFLFGASLQHIMRTIPGKSFRLIPASQFTPDVRDVLTHARWGSVFEELALLQSKLLVYMPVDADGAEEFSDRVGHTFVLADARELDDVKRKLSVDADVIGVLVPLSGKGNANASDIGNEGPEPDSVTLTATAPVTRSSDEAFEKVRIPKDSAREALIADLRARQRAALMAPPPPMTPLPTEEAVATTRIRAVRAGETPPQIFRIPAQHPGVPKQRQWFSWLLLVLIVSLFAGAWHYRSLAAPWLARLGLRAPTPTATPQVVAPRSNAPAPAPVAVGEPLRYSVAIASYQVLNLAEERVNELGRDEEDIPFYVGPIVVDGTLFYRVMAGPVRDSAAAAVLRDTLIAKRIKTISLGGDLVAAPYAFLLGEFDSRGRAQEQREAAKTKGIPSYVVEVKVDDGSTHYKLYAGAYTGPGEAEFMRPILKAAGLPDNLVERTGSIRS